MRVELIESGRAEEDIPQMLAAAAAAPPPKQAAVEAESLDPPKLVFKKCFIRLKRVGYIETAIEKGYKSVLIKQSSKSAKFTRTRYRPIP